MDSEKVANYKEVIKSGNVGVCLQIKGILVKSPAAGQSVELHCQEVTEESYRQRGLSIRIREQISRLFSPLL